jgi:hypothetical protein
LEQKNENQVNHSRFWDIPPPITQNQHHDNVLSKDASTTQPQPQNHPPPSHPITKFKRSKTPLNPDHSGRGQVSCPNTIFARYYWFMTDYWESANTANIQPARGGS